MGILAWSRRGALVASLILLGACAGADAGNGIRSKAVRLQVAGLELALHATDALGGHADAFAEVQADRDALVALGANFPDRAIAADAAALIADADAVLSAKQAILDGTAFVADFSAKTRVLDARLDEAVKLLVEAPGGSKAEIYIVQRESLFLERMRGRAVAVLAAGEDAASAANGVQRDRNFFGVVIDGLVKGNDDLAIKPVTHPAAKAIVLDVAQQWSVLQGGIDTHVTRLPTLSDAHAARDAASAHAHALVLHAARGLSSN